MECPTCGKSLQSQRTVRQHHTKIHNKPLPNRTCKKCGTQFYDPNSQRTYCENCYTESGSANGNHRQAKKLASCEICGSEFEYYPSNKKGKFCSTCVESKTISTQDYNSSKRKRSVNCRNCGAEIGRHPFKLKNVNYGHFCDLDCYGQWLSENIKGASHHQWEGGVLNYGRGWWKVRRKALKRDQYRCQICGSTERKLGRCPDVHHIRGVRSFSDPENAHKLSNVVSLCRPCHQQVEQSTDASINIGED